MGSLTRKFFSESNNSRSKDPRELDFIFRVIASCETEDQIKNCFKWCQQIGGSDWNERLITGGACTAIMARIRRSKK